MCVDVRDKVIDPACGTGGFLSEAYLQVASKVSEADAVRWANARLYGVDLDDINVKLARALMVGTGDGSTHVKLGDSIREARWGSTGTACPTRSPRTATTSSSLTRRSGKTWWFLPPPARASLCRDFPTQPPPS